MHVESIRSSVGKRNTDERWSEICRTLLREFHVSSSGWSAWNIADDFVIWFSPGWASGKFAERVPLHVCDLNRVRDIRRRLMDGAAAASAIDSGLSAVHCLAFRENRYTRWSTHAASVIPDNVLDCAEKSFPFRANLARANLVSKN